MTTPVDAGTPQAPMPLTPEALKEWTRPIEDPEMGFSLLDLGLIYECQIEDAGKVNVRMTLTTPACPAAGYIVQQVKERLMTYPGVTDAQVELVWEPKWDPKTMASDDVKDKLGIW